MSRNSFRFLPYGRQQIDEEDIQAVVETLRSDFLTTGPKVGEFEQAVAGYCGAEHAVAVSSGTAALHAAMFALGVGPGDEVVVPPMTFAASANCVLYQGARPVFADVDPGTLLIDPEQAERAVTPKTRAIVGVDYAGQPCDWDALRDIADRHGLALVADGCHALGGEYKGRKVGTLADMTVFSFHPVKHVATGEGGMVVTDDAKLADRLRLFRNHGISTDYRQREEQSSWFYEQVELGYNYRITDIQCALGVSQMRKLPGSLARRREIVARYGKAFASVENVAPLSVRGDVRHAYHLYVVRLTERVDRAKAFARLREAGIGVNVHYIPVHLHPYYQKHLGTAPGLCPVAEVAYERIISLPMHPGLTDADVDRIVEETAKIADPTGRG
ncbi:MAG: UDP-4-amino-4,6-dideoxy-N-acetyl-beta-L-altrosamine transaminase [Desulfovibrionaceae bacterium]